MTVLLARAGAGDRQATDELLPVVYDELRRLAAQHLGAERVNHTLQPTALVHEAYMGPKRRGKTGPTSSERRPGRFGES
jgi:hypothetical protein